jgi:hypothetical protein
MQKAHDQQALSGERIFPMRALYLLKVCLPYFDLAAMQLDGDLTKQP